MDKQTKQQFQNLTKLVKGGFEEARTDRKAIKQEMRNGFEEAKKDRNLIRKAIDEKVEGLARIVNKGFDGVDARITKFQEKNKKEHAEITLDFEEINSKLSGVVYRPELIEIDQRLQRIETKLGLTK